MEIFEVAKIISRIHHAYFKGSKNTGNLYLYSLKNTYFQKKTYCWVLSSNVIFISRIEIAFTTVAQTWNFIANPSNHP